MFSRFCDSEISFGGERDVGTTCSQNYKFESKERDTETGNDDFGARYYSSRLGRWLSSDWSAVPVPVPYANLSNPQTLNLYAMVSDNPETFADLDGHYKCGQRCGIKEFGGSGEWAGDISPDPSDDADLHASGATQSQVNAVHDAQKKAQAQQQKKTGPPTKVVRTGKHVYKKPTKINGTKFEGTRYTYKVVDAKGNIVRGPMTVTENLTATSETQQTPPPATWHATNGQFADYVGFETQGSFPLNYFNVVDQTFVVTQDGVSTLLSTTIQQTVSSDANGNVTGVAHTIVP